MKKIFPKVAFLLLPLIALAFGGCQTMSPLHSAATQKNLTQMHALLDGGADINKKDSRGNTPLSYVSMQDNTSAATVLIKRGADVNIGNNTNMTPLMWATFKSNIDLTRLLIENGADVNAADKNKYSALMWTVMGAEQSAIGQRVRSSPKNDAANRIKVLELLIENGAKIEGAHPNLKPQKYAKMTKRMDISNFLEGAAQRQKVMKNMFPIHLAAYNGDISKLKTLLRKGKHVDYPDTTGNTPLIWAVSAGHLKTAEFLIKNGAKVNHFGKHNQTALKTAALYGHLKIIEMLVATKGADLEFKNEASETALFVAAKGGFLEVISVLVKKGAKVNTINKDGDTPLMFVARKGDKDTVIHLAKSGASLMGANNKGLSALNMAKLNNHNSIAEYLDNSIKTVEIAALKQKQPCILKDQSWIYLSGDCLKELANGEGSAINISENISYDGQFKDGNMTTGISYSGINKGNRIFVFDGPLRNGTPNGEGMCFYKGAPEKCEYYMGARVDFLHKQRAELESQRLALEEQNRKMDAKLKEIQKANTYRAPTPASSSGGSAGGSKIMDKVINKGIGMLFDQLF
ncbi:MAG: ankyrin repeat domain-containing protein [Deltaproteobacteria bacterium]|nr:ankyrin repeat domain-containing protein [Deltaproteobacteria bacterium]